MRKLLIGCTICGLAVAAYFFWGTYGSRPKPNVLLITLDTTRWDHVSAYGLGKGITPAIDKLAEEGIRYEHAISPSSWTLPTHASIFTGVLPAHHGAHYVTSDAEIDDPLFRVDRLGSELPTLAEELKKAGYRTGAIISGPLLHSRFGTDRGFDYYNDRNLRSRDGTQFYRNAGDTTSLGVEWLQNHIYTADGPPFFLFLNYFDPHNPYMPPEPWGDPGVPEELLSFHAGHYDDVFKGSRELTDEEQRLLVKHYDGEIKYMDKQIERLFFEMKRFGLYDSTVIVVTSDHGESFGEHRLLGHGRALYEDLIRVPLIVKYPLKDERKGLVERRVSTLGIMPTILKYVGHRIPETVAGGTLDEDNQVLIAEITRDVGWIVAFGGRFDRDMKAIYDGDYKLIWNSSGEHELYNIADDPGEQRNLYGKMPDLEQRLQAQLVPLIGRSRRTSSSESPEIDPELRKSLKALGYIR